jgi:hypothetical protein
MAHVRTGTASGSAVTAPAVSAGGAWPASGAVISQGWMSPAQPARESRMTGMARSVFRS